MQSHNGKPDSYDTSSCLAVIRAAERTQSPAMILLFPATLRQFGRPFLKFILDAARSSTVPIAVHLDHATTAEDIDLVLTWAEQSSEKEREAVFDSIMIDASHAPSDEENLSLVIPHIQRATACRIPVEVELGRLEGGEAGLRVIEAGGQELTDPGRAERFMNESGAVVLAPSIGNLHGKYLREPDFRLDM
jgi:fructose-bisphosphate aldolase class II